MYELARRWPFLSLHGYHICNPQHNHTVYFVKSKTQKATFQVNLKPLVNTHWNNCENKSVVLTSMHDETWELVTDCQHLYLLMKMKLPVRNRLM